MQAHLRCFFSLGRIEDSKKQIGNAFDKTDFTT